MVGRTAGDGHCSLYLVVLGKVQVLCVYLPAARVTLVELNRGKPCAKEIGVKAYYSVRFIKMIRRQCALAVACLICLHHARIRNSVINNVLYIRIFSEKLCNYFFGSGAEDRCCNKV